MKSCPVLPQLIVLLALAGPALAAPPALREQISLNGEWPVGGTVPVYAGLTGFDQYTYEREVTVPAAWSGRVIKVEFGAVNFIASVSVNDTPIFEHIGGWMPFAIDVTRLVQPGATFRLKLHVKGAKHPPITDERGGVAWPVGGWRTRGGIADDVWLRAYGTVHVSDAFIQTSVTHKNLVVDYTLHNAGGRARTVAIAGRADRASSGATEHAFTSGPVTLAPGETREVRVTSAFPAPALYWPDQPTLYHLTSEIREGTTLLDRETRRFGFREIALRGNQFTWNGVRINLYGDYQVFGDTWYLDSARWHSPANWPATVDKLLAMNLRVLRWHHNPVPQYVLDVADEKGLLICSESANYGRDYHKKSDHARYVANALTTIAPWIRSERNHPSIYLWNATNEMTHSFTGPFPPLSLLPLGDEIRRLDPTRPVGYDGDTARSNAVQNPDPKELTKNRIHEAALVDYHYPEGYNKEPAGSIYGWAHLVFPQRPTGAGELLHTRSPLREVQTAVERNTWWLGIWLRGLRFTDWTNVKPACWWFTEADLASPEPAQRQRTLNLRNALAPVALFDRAYDDLGIAPYVTGTKPGGTLPVLAAGIRQQRTLVVYNDTFRDTAVTIDVTLEVAGRVVASGRKELVVELGTHREVACAFDVPAASGAECALVLRTFKRGTRTFEEARRFRLEGAASAGFAPSPVVVLE